MMKFQFFRGDTRTSEEIIEDMIERMDRAINNLEILNIRIENFNDTMDVYSIELRNLINDLG